MTPPKNEKSRSCPPCPECRTALDAVINMKMIIGWRCPTCGRAISIERAYRELPATGGA